MFGCDRDGRVARLGAEPLEEAAVARELRAQHLDGDGPREGVVVPLPHLAHAADGDLPDQPVALAEQDPGCRLHEPSTASMTALAMGAATLPPVGLVADVAAVLDQHRDRDARGVGGREGGEPRVRRLPVGRLRRAGLAGHLHAGDLRGRAGAAVHDADHHVAQRRGRAGRDRRRVRASASSRRPCAGRPTARVWTTYGVISSPPLAIADATIAICIGVARTSRWPIEDCAVTGASMSSGNTLVDDLHRDGQARVVEPEALGLRLAARRRRRPCPAARTRCCTRPAGRRPA